jgi:acyl-CoA thioesterase
MKGTDNLREILGIQIIEVADGQAKLTMKITKNHTNGIGITHGAAIFAIADCAFAEAANYGDKVGIAIQADIKFLKPSFEGDTLTAEAKRVSEGKTFGFYDITIRNQEKTVALFSGVAYRQHP